MNEPLASAAGNAVEVLNAVDYLTGARRDARLHEVTLALAAELLVARGLARDLDEARAALQRALDSGAAAESFERMVAALGGPAHFLAHARALLPQAPDMRRCPRRARASSRRSTPARVGLAVVELGGGRPRAADGIDPAVGSDRARRDRRRSRPGRAAGARPCARRGAGGGGRRALAAAYRLGDAPPTRGPTGDRADRRVEPAARAHGLARRSRGSSGCAALLPGRRIDTLETLVDRDAVRYALTWRHPPGSLQRTAEPRRRSSRSAPASIMCSPIRACRRRRSCAWSIPI